MERGGTYSMANLRGAANDIKKRLKQIRKQTKAPTLRAPKTSRRSHRLTIDTPNASQYGSSGHCIWPMSDPNRLLD